MADQKKQLLEATLAQIEKQFGTEAAMLLGQEKNLKVTTFSSGSLILDRLTGIGGYPRGRIIEIFGPESVGKTTFALHAIHEIQKSGGIAAFIDAEHAVDPTYAAKLGVDVNNLILSQPDSGEQALEIVDLLAKTGAVDLIIVDSVAALTPEAELNGEMREQTIGAQARLMARALRKITGTLRKKQTTIIFINQIREKVGVVFGNPEVTPGGRALKFFASMRIDIRRSKAVESQKEIIGNLVKIKIVKNKLAAPFKVGMTEIVFARGISRESELIELALEAQVFTKKGAWYCYQNENIAHGKTNLRLKLEKEPDFFQTIYKILNNKVK